MCTILIDVQDYQAWELTTKEQKIVDARGKLLRVSGWCPSDLRVMSITYKCVDYVHLCRSAAWFYLLAGMFADSMQEALAAIIDYVYEVLATDCDIITTPSPQARKRRMQALKRKAVMCLMLVEREFPRTKLVVCFHNLLHFPDMMARWNNPRNFWAFFMERYKM
jgi:hypothetical protein